MTTYELPDLPAGVYQHYKGPLYLVLGYGHDANAEELHRYVRPVGFDMAPMLMPFTERAVVIYVGLMLDDAHTGPRLAVRTVEDFAGWVHEDGTTCTHRTPGVWCEASKGVLRQRFRYLGPSYEGQQ